MSSSPHLRIRWHDDLGDHSVDIERTTVLGSSPSVDVVVTHPTVSGVHAEIEPGPTSWVRDLGSSDGTFVDRVEVRAARITSAHTLRLGSIELRIETAAADGGEVWPSSRFGPLLGKSQVMRELFATLANVAKSDVPVLVRGETGTGKELVARAIHEASPRAAAPYVVVDCASLAKSLLESELFGHARGAFTGATAARPGAIEAASGGTVFLDEIGELPIDMQPKLLRVLEQKTVRRLGEREHRPVDVRFIAATHRDLADFVARGWFREDLYFRLAVLPIHVPPLRERLEDVPLLARHMLGAAADDMLTSEVTERLAGHPWRGNVRELRNVLDRVQTLGPARALSREEPHPAARATEPASHRPRGLAAPSSDAAPPPDAITMPIAGEIFELSHRGFSEQWSDIGERMYLERKLTKHGGNVSKVAREIELARTYTHKLIKKHGL